MGAARLTSTASKAAGFIKHAWHVSHSCCLAAAFDASDGLLPLMLCRRIGPLWLLLRFFKVQHCKEWGQHPLRRRGKESRPMHIGLCRPPFLAAVLTIYMLPAATCCCMVSFAWASYNTFREGSSATAHCLCPLSSHIEGEIPVLEASQPQPQTLLGLLHYE